ncbi:MFS transporter [Nocardia stercoris]|uniref:MFS transporter n=1 Tax=Nocardia stercoris TaxID=2483361 RepID=A0A3M2KVW0_9NOCA|nr:aromatic acid/H+ symport family MFS transporter [Nocardia stercoris]RMI28816.1 MFS transporter [Nocardia stercoris]
MRRSQSRSRAGLFVVALCFLTTVADGYDLIVYGATVPKLLHEPGWHLTPGAAGAIGSWTLAGLMVGFLVAGPLSDRLGRRKIMIMGVAWFSVGSLVCSLAQSPEFLGAARFLTGIGLGGVVPSAIALTVEFAPKHRRQLYNGLTLTGYSIGGIISALAAIALLPDHGWRMLYAIAALYALILPIMYFTLPESLNFLVLQGKSDEARKAAERYGLDLDEAVAEHGTSPIAVEPGSSRGYRQVIASGNRTAVALFAVVCFCGQLISYGLNTWLPQLMRQAGYPLGSALQFLLVMQIGAIVGMVGGALLGDRFGPRWVVAAFFLVGGISLVVLSQRLEVGLLMLAVAGAGLGSIGTTALGYGYIATHFPASCRGSALGITVGLGRVGAIVGPLVGGWVIGAGLGGEWSFYAFAIPAFAAAAAVVFVVRAAARNDGTDLRSDEGLAGATA